ncbi:hypothetical protein BDQ17DRAFT_1283448 [Cyathus striatus]|nr:hypothetical protein BDQ17DRAFT_1283448 [Cyathus striatus]
MTLSFISIFTTVLTFATYVLAERHIVTFDNRCGYGTPRLIQGSNILSNGEQYTSNGPINSAIAYLQTGNCGFDGIGCSLVEMSLVNPTCPGCGSSADISLIPPLAFSDSVEFTYYGGCDGSGATCSSKDCETAFFVPDDNQVQVQCQEDDVNLKITFCPSGPTSYHKRSAVTEDSTYRERLARISRRISRIERSQLVEI